MYIYTHIFLVYNLYETSKPKKNNKPPPYLQVSQHFFQSFKASALVALSRWAGTSNVQIVTVRRGQWGLEVQTPPF